MNKSIRVATMLAGISMLAFAPSVAHACACGCGIFEVGTASMLPTAAGGISPGIEYDIGRARLYSDLEVPVYQYMHGDQLVAPLLVKFSVGYSF